MLTACDLSRALDVSAAGVALHGRGGWRDRDALAIYDEVLVKSIELRSPAEMAANRLFRPDESGGRLTEPAFVGQNRSRTCGSNGRTSEIQQLATSKRVEDRNQALAHVRSIGRTLDQRYGLSSRAVIMEFASGATPALDEYSGFLTGSQMDEVFSQIGNFVGRDRLKPSRRASTSST
jgi:hypothetical protein